MRSAVGMRTLPLAAATLLAAVPPALGDTWPAPAHDAANTARSTAVSAQRPALLPGWPLSGLPATDVLAGSAGPELLTGSGLPLLLNPTGTVRAVRTVIGLDAIGPDDRRYAFRDFGNRVAAFTPTGAALWVSPTVELGPEASGRTIVPAPEGTVYVSGTEGVAALDGATGTVRWTDRFGFEQQNALAVAPDGTVVFGREGADPPHAVVARRPDGSLRWTAAADGGVIHIAIAPDGAVVVAQDRATAAGGAALRAYDADGAPRWSVPTGLTPPSRPAIGADGTVYTTVNRAIIVGGDIATTGTLLAIAPDGTPRWSLVGRWSAAGPVVGGDGLVYAGGSPLTAVRPDGTVAWRVPGRAPMAPVAIGRDGTLYARFLGQARSFAAPASTLFAFAAPGAPSLRLLPPPRGGLLASVQLSSTRIRTTGRVSLCTPVGRCSPSAPLGATITIRLAREAAVTAVVRRAGSSTVVARLSRRMIPGTSWRALSDLRVLVPRGARALPPGRYVLSVRAAAGRARATAAPIGFTVVGARTAPAG